MKIKPILFNTEMARAILDNRKTVTRRVVKLKYSNTHLEVFTNKYGTRLIEKQNEVPGVTTIKNPDGTTTHTLLACIEKEPPYRPGNILYVRETFSEELGKYVYKADGYKLHDGMCWHPSIHMPREAARIFLRVTDVRVERLNNIAPQDIRNEGMEFDMEQPVASYKRFVDLWDSTIKPADRTLYGWDASPWVWVIGFERISKEEAEMA